jgi:hypothetical protein
MTITAWQRLPDRIVFTVQIAESTTTLAIRFGEFRGVKTLEFDHGDAITLPMEAETAILALAKTIVAGERVEPPISLHG